MKLAARQPKSGQIHIVLHSYSYFVRSIQLINELKNINMTLSRKIIEFSTNSILASNQATTRNNCKIHVSIRLNNKNVLLLLLLLLKNYEKFD